MSSVCMPGQEPMGWLWVSACLTKTGYAQAGDVALQSHVTAMLKATKELASTQQSTCCEDHGRIHLEKCTINHHVYNCVLLYALYWLLCRYLNVLCFGKKKKHVGHLIIKPAYCAHHFDISSSIFTLNRLCAEYVGQLKGQRCVCMGTHKGTVRSYTHVRYVLEWQVSLIIYRRNSKMEQSSVGLQRLHTREVYAVLPMVCVLCVVCVLMHVSQWSIRNPVSSSSAS